ncbi:MAG TPA: histidine phosphatase family protein [Steroidobacteraceae bacterium]|nr:histidine phosphatase family protein [Steroidobacteraceae bacterium]
MELLIVRHAIACERDAKRWPDDGSRPLSTRGVMRARRAAVGLKTLALRPTRVLTSPLERTRQTAAILTRYAGWPPAAACRELVPGGSPQALLAVLARTRGSQVAVVGHQPDLGRLIAACLAGSAAGASFHMRKMSVALIRFAGPPRAGQGELCWLLQPKLLRGLH